VTRSTEGARRNGLRYAWLLVAVGAVGLVGAVTGMPALAPLALAGVVLVLVAPLFVSLARSAAWSVPLLAAGAVVLGAVAVDVGSGAARYAPTLAVVLAILLVGVRIDLRSRALWLTVSVLFAYGLVGTLYGRIVFGTVNGTLPLIGPLLIACLPPVRSWFDAPSWRLGLRLISVVAALVSVLSGMARLGLLPAYSLSTLNHEKAFFMVLGVATAIAARDRALAVVCAGALAFAFTTYPAATYVLVVGMFVGTLALVRLRPGRPLRVVMAVGVVIGTLLAILHIDQLIAVTTDYFALVGKQNNGDTRAELYHRALGQLGEPLFSKFFTNDITVVGDLSGTDTVVPVHNDYLSVALGGGVVAAALLLAVFLLANGLVIRTLADTRDPFQRRTIVALLGALNAAAAAAFANPVFMNPGTSALVYATLAALVAACRVAPQPPAVENVADVRRARPGPVRSPAG
jgi:hypothetical protein